MWASEEEPALKRLSLLGWFVFSLRLLLIAIPIFSGFILVLVLRLIGLRSLAQWITCRVMRVVTWATGLRIRVIGQPAQTGLVVSNHVSWLDIITLNAVQSIYFVAKSEVASWPLIGQLARGVGTAFVERRPSQAAKQRDMFLSRLTKRDRLLFFPEGTSTDGHRVIDFKPTLFAALFEEGLREVATVQPVSLIYHAPKGERADFYGWWGEMDFGNSFKMVLGQMPQGKATIVFHDPLNVRDFQNRAALAKACETAVRQGLEDHLNRS